MLHGLLNKRIMATCFKKTITATILTKDQRYKSWEDTRDAMN